MNTKEFNIPAASSTIKEYGERILELSIDQFIIYYFLVSVVVSTFQVLVGMKLDTGANIRTNPKILLSLSILYIFKSLYYHLASFPAFNDLTAIAFTISILGLSLFLTRELIVIRLFKLIHRLRIEYVRYILNQKDSLEMEWEFNSSHFKNREKIFSNQGAIRSENETIIIDVIVLIILVFNIFQVNKFLAAVLTICGIVLLANKPVNFKSYMRSYKNNPKQCLNQRKRE